MFTCGPGLFGGSPSDPYWTDVLSLVYFNGTVGSSVMVDQVTLSSWSNYGSPNISSTQSKFLGTSGYFNGSSGIFLNRQANIGTGDFTVDVWVYTTSLLGNTTILCGQQDSTTQTVLQIRGSTTGQLEVLFRPNGGGSVTTLDGSAVISINTWHLLSISRVSGTIYTFLDGALQTSGVFSGNLNCSSKTFTFGGLYDGSSGTNFTNFFTGYLTNARVTVGVGRYTSSFTPPSTEFPNH